MTQAELFYKYRSVFFHHVYGDYVPWEQANQEFWEKYVRTYYPANPPRKFSLEFLHEIVTNFFEGKTDEICMIVTSGELPKGDEEKAAKEYHLLWDKYHEYQKDPSCIFPAAKNIFKGEIKC